jgi:hypothetical protein
MGRITRLVFAAALVLTMVGAGQANAAAQAYESVFVPGIGCRFDPSSCSVSGNFRIFSVGALSVSQGLVVNTVTGQEHVIATAPSTFLEFGSDAVYVDLKQPPEPPGYPPGVLTFDPASEGASVSIALSLVNDVTGASAPGFFYLFGCGILPGIGGCPNFADNIDQFIFVDPGAYTATLTLTAEAFSPIPEPSGLFLLTALLLLVPLAARSKCSRHACSLVLAV